MPEELANFRRIAFLFAVADEMRPLAARLTSRSTLDLGYKKAIVGQSGSREILLIAGGMGARCAARAAEAVVSSWVPGALMVAGVAGALTPDLRRGDLLQASAVHTGETFYAPPLRIQGVTEGRLLSIDRVLVTAEHKAAALKDLGDCSGPIAVEMETAAAAQVAERHGLPWGAVRAISDGAEESLPLDFNHLRNKDGDLPVSTVALVAIRRPVRIPGLIRLGSATNHAAKALAKGLIGALGS